MTLGHFRDGAPITQATVDTLVEQAERRLRYGDGMQNKQRRARRPVRQAKITVSIPAERLARARSAVAAGDAPSVSAYVDAAIAEKQRQEDLETILNDMARVDGPATEEEQGWVQSVLGD